MNSRERRSRQLARFGAELEALRIACGKPSYAQLRRSSPSLPPATVSDVLNGKSAPRLEFVTAFVAACGTHARMLQLDAPEASLDLQLWHERWRALQESIRNGETTDPVPGSESSLRQTFRHALMAVHQLHLRGDREGADREVREAMDKLADGG